jgi:hypothetical protein
MPKMSTEDFLKLMSQLESSGGKQLNHPAATKGISAGEHAVGQYGLMPQTSYEVVHPTGGKVQTDPNMWQYNGLDKDQLAAEITKNPDLEHSIASQYADKILNRAQNPDAAAAMWNYGASKPFSQDDLDNSQRVQKFQMLRNSLNPAVRIPASEEDVE